MAELRVLVHSYAFDASAEFYGTTLGMPVTASWGADANQGRGVLFAATDDARIEIIEGGGAPPTGLTVSIQTDDVAAVAARLGPLLTQQPTDQPWGHRNCAALDPNGVTVVFFQVL